MSPGSFVRRLQINDSYQHPGKWQDVTLVPTVTRSAANQFVMSHIVRGLERSSVYEAVIHAKNRYGWNEVSSVIDWKWLNCYSDLVKLDNADAWWYFKWLFYSDKISSQLNIKLRCRLSAYFCLSFRSVTFISSTPATWRCTTWTTWTL